jgi:serine/threonine-protein kinase
MARDPEQRPKSAGQLARGLEEAVGDAVPETTKPMAAVPFQRDERPEPLRSAVPPRPREPVAARRTGLPGWIPLAAVLLSLAVAAGAIAALTSGGENKATAPVIPAERKPAEKKPAEEKKAEEPTPTQTEEQAAAAPAETQEEAPASGNPQEMQLQAHNLINQGKYEEAIALDRKVVEMGPDSGLTYAYALYDLGHALRLAGRPEEAIPILEERMKINNQRGVVKKELERARQEAGQG